MYEALKNTPDFELSLLITQDLEQPPTYDHLRSLPPLATQRKVDDFEIDQPVLVMITDNLEQARVKSTKQFKNHNRYLPLPDDIAASLQSRIDQLTADGYDWSTIPIRTVENETEKTAELVSTDIVCKGNEAPSAKVLHMLGVLAVPGHPQIVSNKVDGFLHVAAIGEPGIIADVDNNYIISEKEWAEIKNNPLYKKEWLRTGSPESLRVADKLELAIEDRILYEKSSASDRDSTARARARTPAEPYTAARKVC